MSDILQEKINSSKWHTTFYYEQELRSLYMNQILSGLVKPGIYNANFSLVTLPNVANNSTEPTGGLYVYIKKGSTFIFSNYYKKVATTFKKVDSEGNPTTETDTRDVLERSFEYPGTVVIKCVAEEDMCIPLVLLEANSNTTLAARHLLGVEGDGLKKPYYIVAKYVYNPNEDSKYTAPTFEAHLLRDNFDIINIDENHYKETDCYYFIPADNDVKDEPYPLPDGTTKYLSVGAEAAKNVSYLILGKVNPTSNNNYCGNNTWTGVENSYSSYVQYVREHTFVSRGLPEYSNSQIWDNLHTEPHIIPSEDGTGVYLDLPPTQSDDVIVSSPGDWKEVHNIANYGKAENKKTLQIADFNLTPETWKKNIIDYLNSKDIKDLAFFNTSDYVNGTGDYLSLSEDGTQANNLYAKYHIAEYPVICDMVFLKLKKNISNTSTESLLNVFQDVNRPLTKDDFVQYTWLSGAGNVNLDPASDKESDRFLPNMVISDPNAISNSSEYIPNIHHKGFASVDGALQGRFICPQDKCQANIDRLLPLITNNSFIPTVIDAMRKEGVLSADCTALVPMFVSFRKLFKTESVVKEEGKEDVITESWFSVDGVSNFNRVHPANILSFFDLQNSSTKINSFKIKSDNVFNILSVID